MRLKSCYLLLLVLLPSLSTFGQNDFGVWVGAEAKKEISKRFDVALQAQLRLDDNATHHQKSFVSPSISFKAHKHMALGAAYRLSSVPFNSSTSNRAFAHRYTFDLEFRKLIDLIKDGSRLGASIRLRETTELEDQKLTENTLRCKLKFDYNIPKSKFEPFISGELFYRFNNQLTYTATEVVATNAINKLRMKVGASYKIKGGHSLKLYTLIQKQLLSQETEMILGLGYGFAF